MIGSQDFNFLDVTKNVKLGQSAYLLGTSYLPKTDGFQGLQSVELKSWGARAHQRTDVISAPTTTYKDTDAEYSTTTNNYKLSLGRLVGISGGGQYAFADNLIGKGSLGIEQIKYPFSDGSAERKSAFYHAVSLFYQADSMRDVIWGGSYKRGAAENSFVLSAASGRWNVSGFVTRGENGLQGNHGVTVSYAIPIGAPATKMSDISLAQRMSPVKPNSSAGLLTLAATRPAELPQVFLAKVDLTANSRLGISKNCLGSGVTVGQGGVITAPVGPGVTISGVTRNGAAYAAGNTFSVSGDNLVINTMAIPVPSSQDQYVIGLNGAAGAVYQVQVTAARPNVTQVCTK